VGLPFIGFILVIFAFAAVMGGLAFLLIGKKRRGFLTQPPPADSPAKRLADQWLAESLRQLETVPQAGPSPLNEAAHELLELRLEAGRIGEGAKSLRLARQALREGSPVPPASADLVLIVRTFLEEGEYRLGETAGSLWLLTAMGEIPVMALLPVDSNDAACRSRVHELARMASGHAANPLAGGLLYIPDPAVYAQYAGTGGGETSELLRDRRILPVDWPGLSALLTALRLNRKAQRVWTALEEAIRSVAPLAAQTQNLEAQLGALNSDSLKTRIQFENKD